MKVSGLYRRRSVPADLIPLVPRPSWERYYLFEARGEEPHPLSDPELAERCGVDHEAPRFDMRFGPQEMCESQWSCTAAYYDLVEADSETPPPMIRERVASTRA